MLDFSAFGTPELWSALITFLYLDFMDATSTVSVIQGGVV
jgi:AGZA family xanthine/uracil permease-like MFS transporter